MKKIYTTVILFSVIVLPARSQGIPCNLNTFWAVTSGQVEEWLIVGTNVVSNGIIVTAQQPGNSLAFCDNLSGGTFSPTFYCHSFNKSAYYDGSSWITMPSISNCSLSDAAGAGTHLYYSAYGLNCIDRFDGTSFVQLYSSPNLIFSIADLAVDDAGNAWCLMGFNNPYTDSIVVISPAGQVINQFAFSMNTINGYGCFLINGLLYVAFGSANPVHPNSLLPISFTTTAAIAGTPISFTAGLTIDLASCNAGIPLPVAQNNIPSSEIIIYPGIASDYINCVLNVKTNSNTQISIADALGKITYSKSFQTGNGKLETKINISNFSKGIYFVIIDNGTQKAVRKFVKE
ncbi:MAG TPA: T9SS type A sorting domain-containing protein [Bacteroidia bacterium]|nr:T9SS type A sorting domain-containing protein [Bacteroidia bacterium]